MKIGFNGQVFLDPGFRGLTRYTTGLLAEFSQRSALSLELFCRESPLPDHLTGLRVTPHVVRATRETLWLEWTLPRALRNAEIDVFHAPADSGLPWSKPCPLVVTVHDSYSRAHWRNLYPRWKQRAAYWRDELTNLLRADAVLTPSDTTRRELIELGIAPARRVHRVYLAPSDAFQPKPEPRDRETVARYGVAEPYVLYVGGYDRRKNVAGLVEAFLESRLTGITLVVIAKKQWTYSAVAEQLRLHDASSSVRLVEVPRDEIPAFYRQALFFVNLSLWESFSFQIVEAMASGVPLLCSSRKAMPEIAGDAALFVDPNDRTAVTTAMKRLATEPQLRQELRGKGLVRAKEFSWSKTADETLAIFANVLRRG